MINNIKCSIDFIALGAIYLSFVMYFTLMPIIVSIPFIFNHSYVPMSIIPFNDFFSGRGDTVRQILLNVFMTIPFGFLLPIIKKYNLWICILYTFLLSLGIEMLQPLISGYRSADITDLFTNIVGGILGYLLFLLLRPLVEVILKRLNYKEAK